MNENNYNEDYRRKHMINYPIDNILKFDDFIYHKPIHHVDNHHKHVNIKKKYHHLKRPILTMLNPWIKYGKKEARMYGIDHALREISAISYLMGMGYGERQAHKIVESWEINEKFY